MLARADTMPTPSPFSLSSMQQEMRVSDNTVVPKITKLAEDQFHDLAVKVISDAVAAHGRETVAKAMDITVRQLGNIMGGSTPAAFRLYNLRTLNPDALDAIDRRQSLRSVPRDAMCTSDPVSSKLARLLARTIDIERPESDAGQLTSLAELLSLPESELRAAASALTGWVECIDAYREGTKPKLRVASNG